VFRRFYASIAAAAGAPEYPQFSDGLRKLKILNAVMQSNHALGWVYLPGPEH